MPRRSLPLYVSSATWVASHPGLATEPVSGTHADAAEVDWASVGKTLRQRSGVACRVHLVLSARLCRYLVIPWVSTCFTAATVRAYVNGAFDNQLGVTMASHCIEIDWPPYGQPIPATAYPRGLVDGIQAGLASNGCVLDGVEASVGPMLRRYGRALPASSALLAYAEDDGITGVTVDGGRVVQVESLVQNGFGLDDAELWLVRKRISFADDGAMHWLGSDQKPTGFVGTELPLDGGESVTSPGHAVVSACL